MKCTPHSQYKRIFSIFFNQPKIVLANTQQHSTNYTYDAKCSKVSCFRCFSKSKYRLKIFADRRFNTVANAQYEKCYISTICGGHVCESAARNNLNRKVFKWHQKGISM